MVKSTTKKLVASVSTAVAPKIIELAPGVSTTVINQALQRAIEGVGPLPGAAAAADRQLRDHDGNLKRADREWIEHHAGFAAAEGFVTNIGGLVTATVTIPANVTGLALIQSRMVAGIAHLHGYDLADPRVRDAILICLLGEDKVDKLVTNKKLPAPPMAVATAPVHDPNLDRVVAAEVTAELINRVVGKRLAGVIGRRVPVVGGLVGASVDGYDTWKIGRYAGRELLPRARR